VAVKLKGVDTGRAGQQPVISFQATPVTPKNSFCQINAPNSLANPPKNLKNLNLKINKCSK